VTRVTAAFRALGALLIVLVADGAFGSTWETSVSVRLDGAPPAGGMREALDQEARRTEDEAGPAYRVRARASGKVHPAVEAGLWRRVGSGLRVGGTIGLERLGYSTETTIQYADPHYRYDRTGVLSENLQALVLAIGAGFDRAIGERLAFGSGVTVGFPMNAPEASVRYEEAVFINGRRSEVSEVPQTTIRPSAEKAMNAVVPGVYARVRCDVIGPLCLEARLHLRADPVRADNRSAGRLGFAIALARWPGQ